MWMPVHWRVMGPSPRIRGESPCQGGGDSARRTIPANTGRMVGRVSMGHQRSGPSPRIRGECAEVLGETIPLGTIPANTGRISTHWQHCHSSWDHPREYGENPVDRIGSSKTMGPSPRIRGEYCMHNSTCASPRTIPANTGRMAPFSRASASLSDHPREYGENQRLAVSSAQTGGPSPRIRGESPHAEHA